LVTGYDILFFWVARMMMFGTFVGDDAAITLDASAVRRCRSRMCFYTALFATSSGAR